MWVQKIPEFHSGHILKQEMMVELSAYLYHLGPLLYQKLYRWNRKRLHADNDGGQHRGQPWGDPLRG